MSSQKPSYGNQDDHNHGSRGGGFDNDKRPFNYDENSGPGYNVGRANGPGGRPPSGKRGPS